MELDISSSECNPDESLASTSSDLSVADLCIASIALPFRADRLVAMRMNWYHHIQSFLYGSLFHMKYRMSITSCNKLLELLSPVLCIWMRSVPMLLGWSPFLLKKIMLHCVVQFLAGGSYHDICAIVFFSITLACPWCYLCLWCSYQGWINYHNCEKDSRRFHILEWCMVALGH